MKMGDSGAAVTGWLYASSKWKLSAKTLLGSKLDLLLAPDDGELQ